MLVTVLGSCVSACLRDRVTGIGGMNHFMLPEAASDRRQPRRHRRRRATACYAMELLINEL